MTEPSWNKQAQELTWGPTIHEPRTPLEVVTYAVEVIGERRTMCSLDDVYAIKMLQWLKAKLECEAEGTESQQRIVKCEQQLIEAERAARDLLRERRREEQEYERKTLHENYNHWGTVNVNVGVLMRRLEDLRNKLGHPHNAPDNALSLLKRLVQWQAHMGGWEAPVWKDAIDYVKENV